MDVRPVAGLVRPWLGGEGCHQAGLGRHAPDGLAHQDLGVGGLDGRPGRHRQLLLPVPQLGVVLLHLDALLAEGRHGRVGHLGRGSHPDRGKAQALVDRDMAAVPLGGQAPLVLHRTRQDHPPLGQAGRHPLEEVTRPRLIRLPVQPQVVDEHRRGVRRIRQDREGVGVGYQADLPHRAHPLDRLEPVQGVHRLHGHGETDPGADPVAQPLHMRGLAADDATVVAIKEPDEPDGLGPAGVEDLLWRHRSSNSKSINSAMPPSASRRSPRPAHRRPILEPPRSNRGMTRTRSRGVHL